MIGGFPSPMDPKELEVNLLKNVQLGDNRWQQWQSVLANNDESYGSIGRIDLDVTIDVDSRMKFLG